MNDEWESGSRQGTSKTRKIPWARINMNGKDITKNGTNSPRIRAYQWLPHFAFVLLTAISQLGSVLYYLLCHWYSYLLYFSFSFSLSQFPQQFNCVAANQQDNAVSDEYPFQVTMFFNCYSCTVVLYSSNIKKTQNQNAKWNKNKSKKNQSSVRK